MNRHIWCLWEPEGTLPPYLQLCLRTIERNAGVPVTLLDPREVETLAPNLDPGLAAVIPYPGQRSDYYRSHLLAAQGGMWLDVDTVVVRDVNWAFQAGEVTGLALRTSQDVGMNTTPLVAAAESPALLRWIQLQEEILRRLEPGDPLPWTALGAATLTVAIGDSPFFELRPERVCPIPWRRADLYMSRLIGPDVVLGPELSMVTLYNEKFPAWLKTATEREIRTSPVMVSRLLRIALGESTPAAERRRFDSLGHLAESSKDFLRRSARSGNRRVNSLMEQLRSEPRDR